MLETDKEKVCFGRHSVSRFRDRVRASSDEEAARQLSKLLLSAETFEMEDSKGEYLEHKCGDLAMIQRGSMIVTIYFKGKS